MCGGTLRTLYDPTPVDAAEGFHPPLLVDANGRLFVRLGDRLDSAYDSVKTAPLSGGVQANVWSNVAVPAGTKSAGQDVSLYRTVDIFGSSSGAGNLNIYVSQDNVNFYKRGSVAIMAGDFFTQITVGANYVALAPDVALTLTATLAGKG